MERKTYTLTEIAQLLERPRTTLSKWVVTFQDCIPVVKKGRTTKFPAEAIEVFRLIADMKADGKNQEAIRQALQAPITESVQKPADTLLWPDDLKSKIFQNAIHAQTRSLMETAAAVAASEAHAMAETSAIREPEPSLERNPMPKWTPSDNGEQLAEPAALSYPDAPTASESMDAEDSNVALALLSPQEQNQDIQVLQQALGEVRTEIATSTYSLMQQIATLNEQIRAQQITIVSLQKSLERARREQRSSLWKRLLVWT